MWVNLSGGLLSYEWWCNDKAECHHFVLGEGEIGREMADSSGPACMIPEIFHARLAMAETTGVRVHLNLFSAEVGVHFLWLVICVSECVGREGTCLAQGTVIDKS